MLEEVINEIAGMFGVSVAIATIGFIVLLVWSIAWKGVALWKSARLSHTWWFVILLVVNTAGILEIIYIFFIAKRKEHSRSVN